MKNINRYIILFILCIYTVINTIGYKGFSKTTMIFISFGCSAIILIGLVRNNFFKKSNILISLFFISIIVSLLLIAVDFIIYGGGKHPISTLRDLLHYIVAFLFFLGIFCGGIGVIRQNKTNVKRK